MLVITWFQLNFFGQLSLTNLIQTIIGLFRHSVVWDGAPFRGFQFTCTSLIDTTRCWHSVGAQLSLSIHDGTVKVFDHWPAGHRSRSFAFWTFVQSKPTPTMSGLTRTKPKRPKTGDFPHLCQKRQERALLWQRTEVNIDIDAIGAG